MYPYMISQHCTVGKSSLSMKYSGLVPLTHPGMSCASHPSSLPYNLDQISRYFRLPIRWRYSSKSPVSSSNMALRSSFRKHRLAHFFVSIIIWPTSIHDNMTLAMINQPWVWLLVFRNSGLKTAGFCPGVALGICLCGRLGVGVCGGATAGGDTSWVMIGGSLHGLFIGDATTASVGYATISCRGPSSLSGTSSTLGDRPASTIGGRSASTFWRSRHCACLVVQFLLHLKGLWFLLQWLFRRQGGGELDVGKLVFFCCLLEYVFEAL